MKIYLASTGPGKDYETGEKMKIPRRLLSYYLITCGAFKQNIIFENIKKKKRGRSRK